jgi:hypothetical protein
MIAALQRASGVNFTMRDTRRSTRTLMARLGVLRDIAELAIGHQAGALVAICNKDQAWPDRVAAFEKVSAHIAGLLAAAADDRGSVVTLQAREPR